MSSINSFVFVVMRRVALSLICVASALHAQDGVLAVVDSLPAMSRSSLTSEREEAFARRLSSFGVLSADLRRVYGSVAAPLLWTHEGVLTPSARATLDALSRAGDRGLDPAIADVSALRALAERAVEHDADRVSFDLALSAASLQTLRALHGVRENAVGQGELGDGKTAVAGNIGIGGRPRVSGGTVASVAPGNRTTARATASTTTPVVAPTDSATAAPLDLVSEVRALATADRPDDVFDAAEPASQQYRLLRNAVGTYRTLGARDSMAQAQLTRILATLARARAQRDTDMNVGVVVNIPAFTLHANSLTDSAADTLNMDVVVGVAGQHRTPEMRDSIRYIVFAPYWEVPMSIVRAELLPIAQRDPYLLTLNNYQLIDRRNRVLPATAASVKLLASGRARVRQLPGGTNSLGKVKFMFPNSDDVYLHDTPHVKDFTRYRRDQSHGCVRVADPTALAAFLLRDQPEWTAERIAAAMNGKTPVTVKLTRPVPIHLTYATAVARPDGSVDFFDDIYGIDSQTRF